MIIYYDKILNVFLNGNQLEQLTSEKLLGVTIKGTHIANINF